MMTYNCQALTRYQTLDEVSEVLAKASSVVKLVCGVANNAAFYLMMDAHDKVKAHPKYKHELKKTFKAALERWRAYEAALVNPTGHRFFHLEDMSPSVRKKYGDITDREYYDFWANTGAEAYQKTHDLVTSLQNKYKKSLDYHHVANSDKTSWVMAAMAGLEIACKVWASSVDECAKEYGLPKKLCRQIYEPFDLRPVADIWRRALFMLEPLEYELESTEDRNIAHGLRQLEEAWVHPKTLYGSAVASVDEYDEVFRTPGEQKKAARELGEIYDEIMNDL